MSAAFLPSLDILLIHDEILYENVRNNSDAPAPDIYTRTEANEIFDEKADKTDLDDYYTKSETYAKVE
ncbi:MAG: hypothetical protein EZS28_002971, partial [Streblomastix strix]